ncbi:RNase P subunit p30-domain-containing protein [Absidia repens]|uniref:RNase P subunit p30-domain-containing protein n=1 Tax=Absidia repens TaxID=90262 RepID=A0A1X2II40_9FUNG|nr:RNase P subunit p30-domain-containing protein [Absidia repens]
MYYDFNLPSPKNSDKSELDKVADLLNRIQSIDRAIVAWNTTVEDFKQVKEFRPSEGYPKIQQVNRVTVAVDNPKKNYQLVSTNPINQNIDILAVQPLNKEACKHTCQTHEIDLVSIDLSTPGLLPGYVTAQQAINRGIFFEICYTQAIRDPQRRALFYSNVTKLVQQTRGHNLILSSGALRAIEIKRPADIRIMALMFGMTEAQAENAVGHNYHRLLKKAETRKTTILAAIRVNSPVSSSLTTEAPVSVASSQTITTTTMPLSNQQKRKQQKTNNNKQQKKQKIAQS